MKSFKTLFSITAISLLLASVQAHAIGLTYDSCENYYSTNYGIDMTPAETVIQDTSAITPWEPQPVTTLETSLYGDPRNFYNW